MLGKLGLDPVRVGIGQVGFGDGDDDRHARRARVVERFQRLRHYAFAGRDNQDRNVRDLGAAGPHRGERFVARRVEEHDRLVLVACHVGAGVLGDAADLGLGDLGLANVVEQRGLAVVNVAHDYDNRGAWLGLTALDLGLDFGFLLNRHSELVGDQHDGLEVEALVQGREHAHTHGLLDDIGGSRAERVGEFGDGHVRVDLDRGFGRGRGHRLGFSDGLAVLDFAALDLLQRVFDVLGHLRRFGLRPRLSWGRRYAGAAD